MKHPGPWTVGKHLNCVYDSTRSPDSSWPEDGRVVTVTIDEELGFADDEARRLILAAPELLEALKAIISVDDQCAIDFPHNYNGEDYAPFAAARALIDRIEGAGS